MDICGEHGDDIAFAKVSIRSVCPACEQIDELKREHQEVVDGLEAKLEGPEA